MKLIRELPAGRSYEQVLHHYRVEKEIADRLKSASRQERASIYRTMYDELFEKVPDHPRLTRRASEEQSARKSRAKMRWARPFLSRESDVLEFAPGDCRFAFELCREARKVYGVDISDQSGRGEAVPPNFELVIYDGYELPLPAQSVDLVLSDQLIEHIHPEDAVQHLQLAHRILRPGGRYVFRTPHRFGGPHDVSQYFSDEPQGFHLKEYTITELGGLLKEVGYSSWAPYWQTSRFCRRVPRAYIALLEGVTGRLPASARRKLSRWVLPRVFIAARR